MKYIKFLEKVIKGGIEGAKRDYKRKDQKMIREGSVAGFEACQGKNPIELGTLLNESKKRSNEAMMNESKDYWYHRGFTLEVGWVCNVVSVMLMNNKQSVIITPTARGVIRAAEIIGIAEPTTSTPN